MATSRRASTRRGGRCSDERGAGRCGAARDAGTVTAMYRRVIVALAEEDLQLLVKIAKIHRRDNKEQASVMLAKALKRAERKAAPKEET